MASQSVGPQQQANLFGSPPPSTTSYVIDVENDRYPFCVVWTPIPIITWILPFVGHMGICDSSGVIFDFAGPYFVSRDNMAFGRPVKYWCLHPSHTDTLDKLMGVGIGDDTTINKKQQPRSELTLDTGATIVVDSGANNSGNTSAATATSSASDAAVSPAQTQQQQPPAVLQFTSADMWDAGLYRSAEQYKRQMYSFFCNNCHSFVANCLDQMEQFAIHNPRGGSAPTTSGLVSSSSSASSAASVVGGGGSGPMCRKGSSTSNTSNASAAACASASGCVVTTTTTTANGNTINHVTRTATVNDTTIKLNTWNMVTIGAKIFFFGKYVSVGRFLLAHLPFMILVALIIGFSFMGKSLAK